jgi:outer membrane protein
MVQRIVLWVSLGLIFAPNGVSVVEANTFAQSHTLEHCYQLAIKRSASLAGQLELVNQAEERIHQARAGFFPSLSLSSNVTQQEATTIPLLRNIFSATQITVQATVKQNLFSGLRDLANLNQRGLERESLDAAKEQAKVQLFQDTTQAFYGILSGEQEIQNYFEEISANKKRKDELVARVKVAQARESDLATIDSSIANLEASLSSSRGVLDTARETLAFLTELPAELIPTDTENDPKELGEIETWLSRAQQRPDLIQAQWALDAAEKAVQAAWGGHLPSIDAWANYYFQRPGIYQGINWDVQLGVSLPLFSGGLVQAQVGEAVSKRRGSEAALEQAQRQADREIRSLFKSVRWELDQVSKLEKASVLSRRNYELLLKDNKSGIVTNLDVLQALANSHQIKRSWDRARWSAKSDYIRLQIISGSRKL